MVPFVKKGRFGCATVLVTRFPYRMHPASIYIKRKWLWSSVQTSGCVRSKVYSAMIFTILIKLLPLSFQRTGLFRNLCSAWRNGIIILALFIMSMSKFVWAILSCHQQAAIDSWHQIYIEKYWTKEKKKCVIFYLVRHIRHSYVIEALLDEYHRCPPYLGTSLS